MELEELALVLVAVALRAALVAHREPTPGAAERGVHLIVKVNNVIIAFKIKIILETTEYGMYHNTKYLWI